MPTVFTLAVEFSAWQTDSQTHRHGDSYIERDIEAYRQIDRETEKYKDSEIQRHRDRQTYPVFSHSQLNSRGREADTQTL